MSGRFKATMRWVSALAEAGASNMTLMVTVPISEWAQWACEPAVMVKYGAEPMGLYDFQFYAPNGIIVRVRCEAPTKKEEP